MSCLQKVVHKIKYTHEKICENVYVWSDGVRSQFRCRYVFKLLASIALPGKTLSWYYNERQHGKVPMDGIGGRNLLRQFTPFYLKTEILLSQKI